MRPSLMMVVDPDGVEARRCIEAMLGLAHAPYDSPRVRAAQGPQWAGAVIAPPGQSPGTGASIITDREDVLLWTGDVALPDAWGHVLDEEDPSQAIARVLLRRLRVCGPSCMSHVDGPFAGAWYDHIHHHWVVFNDRLGLLPIFWTTHGERLVAGPSMAGVWRVSGRPLTFHEPGVIDVIRTQNTVEDRTLIRDVRWLRGGHALIRPHLGQDQADTRTQRHWEFRHLPTLASSREDAADAYVDAFAQVLRQQTAGVDRPVVALSGGMDSRMILAIGNMIGLEPDCFTVGFPFNDDVRYARQLARLIKAPHQFIPLTETDLADRLTRMIIESEGLHGARHLGMATPIPSYLRQHPGRVVLEGHIHGIMGGGCVPAPCDLPLNCAPHECDWARKHAHGGGPVDQINALLHPPIARRSFDRWASEIDARYHRAPGDDPLQKAEFAAINGRSGRNDVLGPGLWRHDVLLRSPGTHRALIDWYARTPGPWRRGKQLYMEILRRRFAPFARVPRSDYSGMPIAQHWLLREFWWQYQKLHRWWSRCCHPEVARWGMGGALMSAWLFNAWRAQGQLETICEPDARIRAWVDDRQLQKHWQTALVEPGSAGVLLTLATLETMMRYLESLANHKLDDLRSDVPFEKLTVPSSRMVSPSTLRIGQTPEQERKVS